MFNVIIIRPKPAGHQDEGWEMPSRGGGRAWRLRALGHASHSFHPECSAAIPIDRLRYFAFSNPALRTMLRNVS